MKKVINCSEMYEVADGFVPDPDELQSGRYKDRISLLDVFVAVALAYAIYGDAASIKRAARNALHKVPPDKQKYVKAFINAKNPVRFMKFCVSEQVKFRAE